MTTNKLTLKATLSPEKVAELNRLKYMKRDAYVRKDQEASRKLLRETFAWLYKAFPKAFNRRAPLPLKLNIEQDLFAQIPENSSISRKKVRLALKIYTRSEAYHTAVAEQEWRVDLDGKHSEKVTEPHKNYAKEKLKQAQQYKDSKSLPTAEQASKSSLSPEKSV